MVVDSSCVTLTVQTYNELADDNDKAQILPERKRTVQLSSVTARYRHDKSQFIYFPVRWLINSSTLATVVYFLLNLALIVVN
ncbi:hypothetical protein B9G39_03210 [Zooshikella ganghwensis]|uniref:Uncharacterized protein n=1 Tax=Zooshikella ganghwensis TaxID=202772 RepID=A0A4P9VL32_9GAMM|nr:hypothetical protein B9G39_03210 [Zooshikella ganghwensis]